MNDQRSPAARRIASSTSVDRRHAVVDEPERLAPERLEHAVGDEAVDLLAHDERRHAERAVERLGARDGLRLRALARAQLDERQQVDGVERVRRRGSARARAIAAASAVGRRPEVDDAISTSGAAAAQASASSACFSSRRSGALSCTSWTPCAASAAVATTVSEPSRGSGTAESAGERAAGVLEHLAELALGLGIGVVEADVDARRAGSARPSRRRSRRRPAGRPRAAR